VPRPGLAAAARGAEWTINHFFDELPKLEKRRGAALPAEQAVAAAKSFPGCTATSLSTLRAMQNPKNAMPAVFGPTRPVTQAEAKSYPVGSLHRRICEGALGIAQASMAPKPQGEAAPAATFIYDAFVVEKKKLESLRRAYIPLDQCLRAARTFRGWNPHNLRFLELEQQGLTNRWTTPGKVAPVTRAEAGRYAKGTWPRAICEGALGLRPQLEARMHTVEPKTLNPMALKQHVTNAVGIKFRLIAAGTYMRGSPATEKGHEDDEMLHLVRLTKPFYIGVTEVTQRQWQQVTRQKPRRYKGPTFPVTCVRWDDAADFCRLLGRLDGRRYRLPTEAEWEYACRAGTATRFCFGDDERQLADHAWYSANSGGQTHPVAQKKPNAWGLYDMHGNVYEWCIDSYDDYLPEKQGATAANPMLGMSPMQALVDPRGPNSLYGRINRGGGWIEGANACRSANRNHFRGAAVKTWMPEFLGFRVLMEAHAP